MCFAEKRKCGKQLNFEHNKDQDFLFLNRLARKQEVRFEFIKCHI